jgi:hypothetical protein
MFIVTRQRGLSGIGIGMLLLMGGINFSTRTIAFADTFEDQEKKINLILVAADGICNVIDTTGNSESEQVKGEVKAQLSGLAAKFADAGISGSGTLESEHFRNVFQQDLPSVLKNNTDCRLEVFRTLKDSLRSSSDAPSPVSPVEKNRQQQENNRGANFAGEWVDVRDREFILHIVQSGRDLDITGSMNTSLTVEDDGATTTLQEGCAPEYQHRGYTLVDENKAGESTIRIMPTASTGTLRYERTTNWFVPCDGHPKGTETEVHTLRLLR